MRTQNSEFRIQEEKTARLRIRIAGLAKQFLG